LVKYITAATRNLGKLFPLQDKIEQTGIDWAYCNLSWFVDD